MKVKRALRIRITNRRRKHCRALALDIEHFKNLLIIFEKEYKKHFGEYLLNESLIYSLLADKTSSRKSPKQLKLLQDTQTGHKKIYIGIGATESKNGIELGKRNNQKFVFVPFRRLINMLKYKLEELGMQTKEIQEPYTSKASCISDDIIQLQQK
ncbi:IS200/IS605 family accessory protein TnpB-related protein [Thermodesulfovibrio hydrogeniphilus]